MRRIARDTMQSRLRRAVEVLSCERSNAEASVSSVMMWRQYVGSIWDINMWRQCAASICVINMCHVPRINVPHINVKPRHLHQYLINMWH